MQIQGTSTWDAGGTSLLGEKVSKLLGYPNQISSPNPCGKHLGEVVSAGPGLGEVELHVSNVLPTLIGKRCRVSKECIVICGLHP
jgi:hypothetical protein